MSLHLNQSSFFTLLPCLRLFYWLVTPSRVPVSESLIHNSLFRSRFSISDPIIVSSVPVSFSLYTPDFLKHLSALLCFCSLRDSQLLFLPQHPLLPYHPSLSRPVHARDATGSRVCIHKYLRTTQLSRIVGRERVVWESQNLSPLCVFVVCNVTMKGPLILPNYVSKQTDAAFISKVWRNKYPPHHCVYNILVWSVMWKRTHFNLQISLI